MNRIIPGNSISSVSP